MTDRERAWGRLKQHPHYRYRACAPHWDNPQACAADDTVGRAVFFSVDEEPQRERLAREAAAKRLCASCPVVEACREYAVGDGPVLREPHQIWGGTNPSERRDILARRVLEREQDGPLPLDELTTPQRQDVLRALAMHDTEEKVQAEAGLSERTTRWQISSLYRLLHVPKPGRRFELLWEHRALLLDAAREAGVMPEVAPVLAAVAERPERGNLLPARPKGAAHPVRRALTAASYAEGPAEVRVVRHAGRPATHRTVVRAPRRDRFRHIPGQEEIALDQPGAQVIPISTARPAPVLQGAAA